MSGSVSPWCGLVCSVLMLSYEPWSDETGLTERTKDSCKLASRHWSWLSPWLVDHKTPGGVDKEGWQYARHFNAYVSPALIHYKTIADATSYENKRTST